MHGRWHQHEQRQSNKARRAVDENKQGTGIRMQKRWGGMFVVGRVCVTSSRILVATTDWACLRSYGGLYFVLKRRKKKGDSGPWNFWKSFILGFRIKNHLSFIILYDQFQKNSNKMPNHIARIITPVALHNTPRVRGARHRRSIRACPTTGGATLQGENRPAQPKCSLASA